MSNRQSHNFQDITGQTFNYLTVISRAENNSRGNARWNCLCKCGKMTVVNTSALRSGKTQSCGCKKFESHNAVHGMTKTDIHNKWLSMKQRCNDPNHRTYARYGAKGIKVCSEWEYDFIAFRDWSYEHGYKEGLSLDRIDNAKGYSPDNCRWVEWREQANNRTSNVMITYQGETKNLMTWCRKLGVDYDLVQERLKSGNFTFEEAISIPRNGCRHFPNKPRKNYDRSQKSVSKIYIEYNGETKSLKEWAEHYDMPYWKLHQRLYRDGYTFEEAITLNPHQIRKTNKNV